MREKEYLECLENIYRWPLSKFYLQRVWYWWIHISIDKVSKCNSIGILPQLAAYGLDKACASNTRNAVENLLYRNKCNAE